MLDTPLGWDAAFNLVTNTDPHPDSENIRVNMQQSQEWGNFLARKWSNQREFLAGALGAECAWCLDNIVRGEQADLSVLQQTREQVDEMSLHNYQKRFAINILDTAISLQETVNNMQPAIQRAVQRVLDDHGQN